jgi:MFS transporter, SP family, inositol transporter
MSDRTDLGNRPWKTAILAGMASYLDAGALVTSGIAIGGSYAEPLGLDAGTATPNRRRCCWCCR